MLEPDAAGGATPIEAQVHLNANVPEPAASFIFLGMAGAIAWRRQRRIGAG